MVGLLSLDSKESGPDPKAAWQPACSRIHTRGASVPDLTPTWAPQPDPPPQTPSFAPQATPERSCAAPSGLTTYTKPERKVAAPRGRWEHPPQAQRHRTGPNGTEHLTTAASNCACAPRAYDSQNTAGVLRGWGGAKLRRLGDSQSETALTSLAPHPPRRLRDF